MNYLKSIPLELSHLISIYLPTSDILNIKNIFKLKYKLLFQLGYPNLYKIIYFIKSKDPYLNRYSWKDLYFNATECKYSYVDNTHELLKEFGYRTYDTEKFYWIREIIYSYKLLRDYPVEFDHLITNNNFPNMINKYHLCYFGCKLKIKPKTNDPNIDYIHRNYSNQYGSDGAFIKFCIILILDNNYDEYEKLIDFGKNGFFGQFVRNMDGIEFDHRQELIKFMKNKKDEGVYNFSDKYLKQEGFDTIQDLIKFVDEMNSRY